MKAKRITPSKIKRAFFVINDLFIEFVYRSNIRTTNVIG